MASLMDRRLFLKIYLNDIFKSTTFYDNLDLNFEDWINVISDVIFSDPKLFYSYNQSKYFLPELDEFSKQCIILFQNTEGVEVWIENLMDIKVHSI